MQSDLPTYLFGLDSSFSSYHKLPIGLIHSKVKTRVNKEWNVLEHRYNNRGVSKVEVTGLIVNLQRKEGRVMMTIDDGTGTIRGVRYHLRASDSFGADSFGDDFNTYNKDVPEGDGGGTRDYGEDEQGSAPLRLGDLVTARGVLVKHETNWHDYAFGLKVSSVELLGGPNLEMLSWTSSIVLHHEVYLKELDGELVGALRHINGHASDPFLYCICCDDPATASVKDALYACKCGFSPCAADSRGALRMALLHHLLDRGEFTEQGLFEGAESRAFIDGLALRSTSAKGAVDGGRDVLVNGIYHVHSATAPAPAPTASSSSSRSTDSRRLLVQLLQALIADGLVLQQGAGYHLADMRVALRKLLLCAVDDLSILNPFYYYTGEDRAFCLREDGNRRSVVQQAAQQYPAVSHARWERCYDVYVAVPGDD